jgi:hypothetical protein
VAAGIDLDPGRLDLAADSVEADREKRVDERPRTNLRLNAPAPVSRYRSTQFRWCVG